MVSRTVQKHVTGEHLCGKHWPKSSIWKSELVTQWWRIIT